MARAGLCGGLFIILGALPCAAQQAPPFYFITQGSLVDAFYYNGTAVSFGANGSGSWNESLSLNYGGPGGQVSTNGSSGPASWSGQFSGTMSLTNTVVPLDCSAYGCLSQGPHGSIRGAVQVYVHGPAGNTFHIVHTGGGSVTATYATNLGGEASSAWSSFSVLASSQHPSQTSAVNISQIIDGISTLPTLTYQGQVYSFAASFNTYGGISLGAPIGYPTTGSASFQVNESISANLVRPNQTPPTAVIDPISAASQNVPVTLDGSHSHANTSGASLIDYKWTIQNSSGGTDTLSGSTVQYTWTRSGTYSVALTVTDSDGLTGSASTSVTVISLSCPTSTATVDLYYGSGFTGSGGTTPYTFSVSSGGIPPGLALDSSSGSIAGIPTVDGTFNFTGMLQDARGQTASASCSIAIGGGQCSASQSSMLRTSSMSTGSTGSCKQWGPITTNGCGPFNIAFLKAAQDILAVTNLAAAQASRDFCSVLPGECENNPAGGINTWFSKVTTMGPTAANGPCDHHDYCYSTCWAVDPNDPLDTFSGHKDYCDTALHQEMITVCEVAESLGQDSKAVIDACKFFADAYYIGIANIPIKSALIYRTDQDIACLCCPNGAGDGSLGPTGGTVTDNLFGAQAQVSALVGVFSSSTAVTIDVLPASLNVTVPPGFSPATYFTTITLMPHPNALPSPGATVVLPLVSGLVPGAKLLLYQVSGSNTLVPELSAVGGTVTGSADSQGFSATFTGVGSFSTVVGLYMPGDLNGDLKVDCSDIAIVKAAYGKNAAQTGFDARADVNFDGVVDIRDLSFVSQKLPAGTRCQ